jgi:hypothetical protein
MRNWIFFLFLFSPPQVLPADSSTDTTANSDSTDTTTVAPETQSVPLTAMSKTQLRNQTQPVIDGEIARIQQAMPLGQSSLAYYQKLNAAYCKLLQKISTQCITAAYIGSNYGLDDLNCSPSATLPPTIIVSLQNTEGKAFYLRADQTYETEVFSEPTQTVLFSSTEGLLASIPRFLDLTTLSLITINPTKKDKGFPTQRPPNLAILITVNGTPLLPKITLIPPTNVNDFFTYQISPEVIPTLRKQVGCFIEAADIEKAQLSARQ